MVEEEEKKFLGYFLKEKITENQIFEIWEAEKDSESYIVLKPKQKDLEYVDLKDTPAMDHIIPSLEKEGWVFQDLEQFSLDSLHFLSDYLKDEKKEIEVSLRIVRNLLNLGLELKHSGTSLPPLIPELLVLDYGNEEVYYVDPFRITSLDALNSFYWKEVKEKGLEGEKGWIYLIGSIGIRLLTGKNPPLDKPISEMVEGFPEELDGFFQKALLSGEGSYASLEEAKQAFEDALEISGLDIDSGSSFLLLILILLLAVVGFLYLSKFKNQKEKKIDQRQAIIQKKVKEIIQKRAEFILATHEKHKNMVWIPGGRFFMGRDPKTTAELLGDNPTEKDKKRISDEVPGKWVEVDGFWMSKYEITYEEYLLFAAYVAITGDHRFCHPQEPPGKNHFPKDSVPIDKRNIYAVNGIDWFDAYGFANFMNLSLPTEAEWELAAKGRPKDWEKKLKTRNFKYPPRYPWGFESPLGRAFFSGSKKKWPDSRSAPFNAFPEGQSIYGVFNMAGNVWEFTLDRYDPKLYLHLKEGAKNPRMKWEDQKKGLIRIVVKGGGFRNSPISLRCAHRTGILPTRRALDTGIRVVLRPKKEKEKEKEKKKKKEK